MRVSGVLRSGNVVYDPAADNGSNQDNKCAAIYLE